LLVKRKHRKEDSGVGREARGVGWGGAQVLEEKPKNCSRTTAEKL